MIVRAGVRERFPGCPELSGLTVMPERQSQGHYVDRYPYLDNDGVEREAADPCRFLVKELRKTIFA